MFDPTLNGVLAQIDLGKIVLPAMQRPFVWKEDRITKLVDSLLRGFPLGTALLWKTSAMQRYRRFQKDIQPDSGITIAFEKGESAERYLVLDGQQRLTSLYIALAGSYDGRMLFIDVLSGSKGEKDPGDTYWDCRFVTQKEADSLNGFNNDVVDASSKRVFFVKFSSLTKLPAAKAGVIATKKAAELRLSSDEAGRLTEGYLNGATVLASKTALQIHLIDEDAVDPMPIEEILEIFVRVNSGGLVLQKSDLLMSLLDLSWNDIQPELYRVVRDINEFRPFNITRDDVLKSLLLASRSETRFDRLVSDRARVEDLASRLPQHLPAMKDAWRALTTILVDDCKITSERFFRGGHNSLLPFVYYLFLNPHPHPAEKRRIVTGIYAALMSGVFAGAEARMGSFTRKECKKNGAFPLNELCHMISSYYGISSLEGLLSRHLDLALNIAHGGISLDNNPENLQRDHIFPRSTLEKDGAPTEEANHYGNFHFLRDKDNLNKSNVPPHIWFARPGDRPAYSDADLRERLLSKEMLQPGNFNSMLRERAEKIRQKAIGLFGVSSVGEIDKLFSR